MTESPLTQVIVRSRGSLDGLPKTLLALDPGGTTGYAIFSDLNLTKAGQCIGSHVNMNKLIDMVEPDAIVCEDYLVYPWASKTHKWSRVPTLRLIGGIEFKCAVEKRVLHLENAQTAKGFVTDKRLREWGYYKEGLPHARDAIRHGCYYLTFQCKP